MNDRRVERVRMPRSEEELSRIVEEGRPVLFEDAMAGWPCVARWTPEYLRERAGHREIVATRSDGPLFRGNPETGHYTPDVLERMTFGELLDRIAHTSPTGTRWYLHRTSVFDSLPELVEDIAVPSIVADAPFKAVLLWMGPKASITQLHHDFTDNFFAMVHGRKRVLLLPPAHDASRFPLAPLGGRSSWHLSRAGTCIGMDRAEPLDVVVSPGEMLLIPAFWWHEVHSIDDPSISLAYWWDQQSEQQIKGTLEAVSEFAAAFEGLPARWKHLLRDVIGRELFETS